jgi:two-component sensor histidine kinase
LSEVITQKFDDMDRTIALKNDLHDADALAIFRTNRGKSLMDEANLFLSSIVRGMDDQLTQDLAEQRTNANWLRWVSIIGGLVIALVVGGVTVTLLSYSREIAETRDQMQVLNATLERRVKDRTGELARARDKAEVLLAEVNHRVANSLTIVASMVGLQAHAAKDKASKDLLSEVQTRIYAISAVHQRLYSSGDTNSVDLSEYLSGLLGNIETAMRDEGRAASLTYNLEPLRGQRRRQGHRAGYADRHRYGARDRRGSRLSPPQSGHRGSARFSLAAGLGGSNTTRHCERSEAIQRWARRRPFRQSSAHLSLARPNPSVTESLDCFAALAMTAKRLF